MKKSVGGQTSRREPLRRPAAHHGAGREGGGVSAVKVISKVPPQWCSVTPVSPGASSTPDENRYETRPNPDGATPLSRRALHVCGNRHETS